MAAAYPEVAEGRERAVLALRHEEERFGVTLEGALAKLEELLGRQRQGDGRISGEEAFCSTIPSACPSS